ncbi:MAG: UDP-N-acetylmuramate:L-alanyl-gamma-D-glutamyl-meso-diaminopimelate ligase, partial [Gammaproteobacteria bacterium]|nr:UDP-N-acetylmuramate:L-alanyl-gamma-D-glutamyl-meso-diaminopimelate ligase [Gammaproteobacteria bacterium]
EPRSNTMKMGIHENTLGAAFSAADQVMFYDNGLLDWNLQLLNPDQSARLKIFTDIEQIIVNLVKTTNAGDNIVIMSNGGFSGIHQKLISALQQKR